MSKRLLLIGLCPPPDGGTTLPFSLFSKYIKSEFGEEYAIKVINSNTGDKSSSSGLPFLVVFRVLKLYLKIFWGGFFSNKIVVFGSQRFITFTGAALIILFKPLGKKVYLRVNGGAYDVFFQNSGFFVRGIARRVLPKANRIIVQTRMVAKEMKSLWGNKVVDIPNYRELTGEPFGVREFKDNKVNFIYTGIVREQKGIRHLVDSYLRMRDLLSGSGRESIKTSLDIYGEIHPDIEGYVDHVISEGFLGINFKGALKNNLLKEEYFSADVFVFPTFWPTEGHSGSVVEAMMSGLPILCTSWRAMPEVVDDGVSGLFFKVGDVEELANLMYSMCINAELRKKLSEGARKSGSRFDVNLVLPRMAECFEL